MHTDRVEYEADGLHMIGHLAHPGGPEEHGGAEKRPGVLVFPEAFGIGDHVKEVAGRLAELGYVALACDLHGQAKVAGGLEEALALLAPIRQDAARIRARSEGGLKALLAHPGVDPSRIGAIGFCFGGTMALELGRGGADVAAIVGFHSGLTTPDPKDAKNIKGRVLVCIGADDPAIDAEQRAGFEREMREGGVNWQMSVYGGTVHSFTNKHAGAVGRPEFAAYNAQADHRSWGEMKAIFAEVF